MDALHVASDRLCVMKDFRFAKNVSNPVVDAKLVDPRMKEKPETDHFRISLIRRCIRRVVDFTVTEVPKRGINLHPPRHESTGQVLAAF